MVCGAPNVSGVCFTGSTKTAQAINQIMAKNLAPHAPLIAETGGLNAMIVDSTALLEQAVQDVVDSTFQSAGQRCSALRMLYVQSDIADAFEHMLCGAMQALVVGAPEAANCDVGPVIDAAAQGRIAAHIARHKILFQTSAPEKGYFIAPTLLSVSGMSDLHEEIFGPVLHLARYDAGDLDRVIDEINASGYGLTFGFHSRIDDRVQKGCEPRQCRQSLHKPQSNWRCRWLSALRGPRVERHRAKGWWAALFAAFRRAKALGNRRPAPPQDEFVRARASLCRASAKAEPHPERFTRPHRRIEPLPLAAKVTRAVHGPRRRNPCTKRPRHGMLRHCRRGYNV
jgi:hypothetical protein